MINKSIIIITLLLIPILLSPSTEASNSNIIPAQDGLVETGELLPNPNFSEQPYVEIGLLSSEFSSEYSHTDDTGQITLIWSHTAGYEPEYSIYYPQTECLEFARISEQFEWTYNQIPEAMRISASIDVTCLGDFSSDENSGRYWDIVFWLSQPGSSYVRPLRTLDTPDIEGTFDAEFLYTKRELYSYFRGCVEIEPGVQGYPSDIFTLYMGLIPTNEFAEPLGDNFPWNLFDGGVIVTIDHLSVEAILEETNQLPPVIVPRHNVTDLWNDTYLGLRIEPAGYDSLAHLSQYTSYRYDNFFSIGMLSSNLQSQWNMTIYSDSIFQYVTLVDLLVKSDRIIALGQFQNFSISNGIHIMNFDSMGYSLWNKTLYFTGYEYPICMDLDSSGNLYIIVLSVVYGGYYSPYQLTYSAVKLNTAGHFQWNKTLATVDYDVYYTGIIPFPKGFGCSGNGFYFCIEQEIMKFDTNGNEVWTKKVNAQTMCVNPKGGIYSISYQYFKPVVQKWADDGALQWSKEVKVDYGNGWADYPTPVKMLADSKGSLYVILDFSQIHSALTILHIGISGRIISHDTIIDYTKPLEEYSLAPSVMDIAITGDGLVHLAMKDEYDPLIIYYPIYIMHFQYILSYQLFEPTTINPLTIILTGIATLIFLGIAIDYFVLSKRRTKLPEKLSVPEFER